MNETYSTGGRSANQPTHPKFLRQVSADQDKLLRILEALKFATVENVKLKDGQIRMLEIRIQVNMEDPESFKKTIEELKSISL